MRRRKKVSLVAISVVALALAGTLAGLTSRSIVRGATSTTVIGGTTYVCTIPCEGQTLQADPSTIVDTAKAVSLIDSGKAALCLTTISGVSYYASPVRGHWYDGLSALTLAQSISPTKTTYDTAGNALMATTVSGKKYCANPSRYATGFWASAFAALSRERGALVAAPQTSGPAISIR